MASRPQHQNGTSKPNWFIVVLTIIVCSGYIFLVLYYDDLRREFFVQRLTAPILTLGIVVVLFSAVPSSARLSIPPAVQKLGFTLFGAAAFFYLILPRITDAMFPPDVNVSGYIYYQTPDQQAFTPVKGAIVQDPKSGQKSQPTDDTGRFELTHLSHAPEELDALYSGLTYQLDLKKYRDGKYPVIPRPTPAPTSPRSAINPNDWVKDPNGCSPDGSDLRTVSEFLLEKDIPALSSFKRLHIRVATQDGVEIAHAEMTEPESDSFEVQDEAGYSRARQWELPVTGDNSHVKLAICLGVRDLAAMSQASVQTSYWFD